MTSIKARAVELLKDIPDDKIAPLIEILMGLRMLYVQNGKSEINTEAYQDSMGIFGKYANSDLIPLEKEAWAEAVKEKHAVN